MEGGSGRPDLQKYLPSRTTHEQGKPTISPVEARGHPIICIFFTLTAPGARSGDRLQLHLPHHRDASRSESRPRRRWGGPQQCSRVETPSPEIGSIAIISVILGEILRRQKSPLSGTHVLCILHTNPLLQQGFSWNSSISPSRRPSRKHEREH